MTISPILHKKTPKQNTIITISLFSLYLLTAVVDFFTNQKIAFGATAMALGALIAFFLVFSRINSIYYFGILGFAFFAQFGGTMLNFYKIIPIYDLLLHFSSGILLIFMSHFIHQLLISKTKNVKIPISITISFCLFLTIASAAVWEIWEFAGDVLLGMTSQGTGVTDTMTDIIAGTVGGIIGSVILYCLLKKKK